MVGQLIPARQPIFSLSCLISRADCAEKRAQQGFDGPIQLTQCKVSAETHHVPRGAEATADRR